ncbi:MAG: hypothetical protein IJS28_09550 [Synergistaceae bacterium]|nr:hypothetical protein [Synergistaceae bacterium]
MGYALFVERACLLYYTKMDLLELLPSSARTKVMLMIRTLTATLLYSAGNFMGGDSLSATGTPIVHLSSYGNINSSERVRSSWNIRRSQSTENNHDGQQAQKSLHN